MASAHEDGVDRIACCSGQVVSLEKAVTMARRPPGRANATLSATPLTASGEDKMQIAQEQYDAISHKAVKIIGRDRIAQMSRPQIGQFKSGAETTCWSWNNGQAEKVSDAEIEEAHELIVEDALPKPAVPNPGRSPESNASRLIN